MHQSRALWAINALSWPAFIKRSLQLKPLPYLADVAQLEVGTGTVFQRPDEKSLRDMQALVPSWQLSNGKAWWVQLPRIPVFMLRSIYPVHRNLEVPIQDGVTDSVAG